MEQQSQQVEVRIWREEGQSGLWRCQVAMAGSFHSLRFESHEALSAYVSSQIDMLVERQQLQVGACADS